MNPNRLGNKNSKEKTRPKSTERNKHLKTKSIENTTEEILDEVDASPASTNEKSDHNGDLKIDRNILQSSHSPQPPKERPKENILIRRTIPTSKYKQNKPKEKILIAKPVDSNNELDISKVIPAEPVEPSNVKSYNILGSYKEFKHQAARERQIQLLSAKSSLIPINDSNNNTRSESLTNSSEGKNVNQTNALQHWEKQMEARRKQQEYLARKMGSDQDMLVMNQSDSFRSVQEERTLIDRAMPLKDYGKGYRVGSEFWKQVEGIGGNEDISITLGETEKGNVASIEHIGHPSNVKSEMGTNWSTTSRMRTIHHNWMNSTYLSERKEYLKDVINELDPHKPYMDELEVIGHSFNFPKLNNYSVLSFNETKGEKIIENDDLFGEEENSTPKSDDPLACYEDVYPAPTFGPSLVINGQTAQWEGPPVKESDEETSIEVDLSFETAISQLCKCCVALTNDGTTVIHFSWRKLPKYDPFGLKKGKPEERFYFDIRDGIILPGQTISIPFVFQSGNAGIFTEQWCLQTHPVLCGGRRMLVNLHAVATRPNELEKERQQLEEQYEVRQNNRMASRIVEDILRGVSTPPRVPSPTPLLTEEEQFSAKNEQFHYNTSTTNKLKEFFLELEPEANWDLSIVSLLKNIENIEDEDTKEDALKRLNTELVSFSRSSSKPLGKDVYDKCYKAICQSMDKFVERSMILRNNLGLPEKEFIIKQDTPAFGKKSKKVAEVQKISRNEQAKSPNKKETAQLKSKTPNTKEKNKVDVIPIPTIQKEESQDSTTSSVQNESQLLNYGKYMDEMYTQVYNCLQEMADNLEATLTSEQQHEKISL